MLATKRTRLQIQNWLLGYFVLIVRSLLASLRYLLILIMRIVKEASPLGFICN